MRGSAPPHKFNNARRHARCNMQGAQSRWGGRGAYNVPPLSGSTLGPHAHHTSICKGVRGVHRVPPSLHWATRDRAPFFYQSPHRSPHTSQVQLRCNGNGTTPRELPPPGHPPPRHAACGGNTVATVHSDLHAVGQLAVTPPPPPPRRIPPPPHTPPPPPPPPPLLPLGTFSRQTRGLPERKTRCHPSPQR